VTTIELHGLEVFGYHGVEEEERRAGQPFAFDIRLEVAGNPGASDRIADTIDYREVATLVRKVSDGRRFRLLEALAGAVADAIVERFPVQRVHVCARKPKVRLDPPVEYSAVTVERCSPNEF
jgi:7,8-dihydroneopterin aldolase/epimerase/oxygenase